MTPVETTPRECPCACHKPVTAAPQPHPGEHVHSYCPTCLCGATAEVIPEPTAPATASIRDKAIDAPTVDIGNGKTRPMTPDDSWERIARLEREVFGHALEFGRTKGGRYVVIRTDMAGVICGVLVDQNEHRTELAEARIIWDWAGEGIETVHDVAAVGVGPRSHVSRPVAHVSIRGCAGEATIEANVLAPKPAIQMAPPGLASRLRSGG